MTEPLRSYNVTVNGLTTRMQLNETDAKAYGDAAKPVDDAPQATTEQASTDERSGSADLKARADVPNKARSTGTK